MNVFKFFVYAIVAVLVLWVFVTFMAPLFFPQENALELLETSLGRAEAAPGKGFVQTLLLEESQFLGQTFDSDRRSVAFECNNPEICCFEAEKGEDCSKKIEWDSRKIRVKQATEVEATTRCAYEHGLFVCKIYFGKKPAQVVIEKAEIGKKIDLDKEKAEILLAVKNDGGGAITFGTINAKVYEIYLKDGKPEKNYLESASASMELGSIAEGETIEKKIGLSLAEAGKYELELVVEGHEAGFDRHEIEFEAVGGSKCRALDCDEPIMEFGECRAMCSCANCLLSSNCEEKIRQQVKQVPFGNTVKEADLSNVPTTPLGSNLVTVVLPDWYCPADLGVSTAFPKGTVVHFVVENLSVNEVKSDIEVEIFMDYGLAGESEVAGAMFSADEINYGENKIESNMGVDLKGYGTFQLTVLVNREKKVIESDYSNNSRETEITVDAPPANYADPPAPLNDTEFLNSFGKSVVNSGGGNPEEILFLVDNSGSMNLYLELASALSTQIGQAINSKGKKFTYAQATINSNGSDERWGDIFDSVANGYKWAPDTEKKHVFMIGDGENNHDKHDVFEEAKALKDKGIIVEGIQVGLFKYTYATAYEQPVIQQAVRNGGGHFMDLTSVPFTEEQVAEEYAKIIAG